MQMFFFFPVMELMQYRPVSDAVGSHIWTETLKHQTGYNEPQLM
jgi:hypothetical protein